MDQTRQHNKVGDPNAELLDSGFISAELLPGQSSNQSGEHIQKENISNAALLTDKSLPELIVGIAWSHDFEDKVRQLLPESLENLSKQMFDVIDLEGNFPALMEACDGQDELVVFATAVVKSHDQLNQRNSVGQSLLHIATASCEPSTVRYIYTKGGDLKYRDVWGNNPLHIAAELGRADCIEQFCTQAKKEEQQHARFGVRFIPINRKEDICLINNDGKAPIHLAVEGGHVETLKMLLQKSKPARDAVDIRRYTDGYSPAHIAVELGSIEMLKLCLESDSDSEVRNFRCETPQQMAYLLGRTDMVRLCQGYGASPDQLHYAVTEGISDSYEDMYDIDEMQSGVQNMQIS